jgi:hypothetical protein
MDLTQRFTYNYPDENLWSNPTVDLRAPHLLEPFIRDHNMTQVVSATNAPTLDVSEAEASRLVELAKTEAEADSQLTIRQALSTSLIMEGFDLAIVRTAF